jgi:predicted DNA-binding mobile mystery protein A
LHKNFNAEKYMRSQKKMLIKQLDRKIEPFRNAGKTTLPANGWISTIRTTLNMGLEQFGKRLNLSKQGAKQLEMREANGAITLKMLKIAAAALDMRLVYGFVPNADSVDALIQHKAEDMARKIVLQTHHNMKLENQENSEEYIRSAIEELTDEIKREMPRALWD